MRKLIERIAFYIRYEMTEEVKARIEMGVLCGTLLIAFGVLGYGLYGLYRQDQQRAEQERASREEMRYFIELMGKPKPHPTMNRKYWMPRMLHRFHSAQGRIPLQSEDTPIGPMRLLIIIYNTPGVKPETYLKEEQQDNAPQVLLLFLFSCIC